MILEIQPKIFRIQIIMLEDGCSEGIASIFNDFLK